MRYYGIVVGVWAVATALAVIVGQALDLSSAASAATGLFAGGVGVVLGFQLAESKR